MPRPGVTVLNRDAPPASGPPIRTGTAFFIGEAEKGAVGSPIETQSMADVSRLLGERQPYSYLWDSLDVFFREGGGSAFVSRVGSSGIATAAATLNDGTGATLTVEASSAGAWANDYTVSVAVSGGIKTLTVKDPDGNVVETHGEANKADLLAYAGWQNITLVDADPTKGDPVAVSNVALSGGNDDRGGIVDADWTGALDTFDAGLGPGQVLAPGRSDATVHGALAQHAADHNRVALLDVPLSDDLATVEAIGPAARATGNSEFWAAFAPWVQVPGIAADTVRRVPYSAAQAGLEARRDRLTDPNTNIAAAGRDYPFQYVIGFTHDYTDAERATLLAAGVNTGKMVYGIPETYGYRSGSVDQNWIQFNYARLRMALTAHGEEVAESFVFDQIDGRGLKAGEFASAIAGMMLEFFMAGALYGSTPAEAFRVDAGPSVNTPTTISAGELHVVVAFKPSPHAEWVVIEFVRTPITQVV